MNVVPDIDVLGRHDCTPLYGASWSKHFEIVQWLLSHGANPNNRSKFDGRTPLHGAAYFGQVEACRILLQYKADICALDNKGQTPLHVAVHYDEVNVARLLLEHGADVNAPDNRHNTPLVAAVNDRNVSRSVEMTRLLVEHGADIDAEGSDGKTAFQVASERGFEITEFLSKYSSK